MYRDIDKHTGKHLTGDRVQILLLTLPFHLGDLIAPEVTGVLLVYINNRIQTARLGLPLHGKALVKESSLRLILLL